MVAGFNSRLWRACLTHLEDTELEALCLDEFPEVYDQFSRGLQRTEKINLLLNHCRRNPEAGQTLALWCQAKFPPPAVMNFVNRTAELNLVLQSFNLNYWVIDAPAGYGKTWFLQELERRYTGQGWLCLSPALSAPATFMTLVTSLLEALQMASPAGSRPDLVDWGEYIASGIERQLAARGASAEHSGVALFLDNLELLPEPLFRELAQLLGGIMEGLKESDFFLRCNELRFFMAGRGVGRKSQVMRPIIPLTVLTLSPYTLSVVQESIARYAQGAGVLLDRDRLAALAAHLMVRYGGHPRCCAETLAELAQVRFVGIRQLLRQPTAQTLPRLMGVLEDLTHYSAEMPRLFPVLETLSVFRRFDGPLLTALQQHQPPLLVWEGPIQTLIESLQATFLISRQETFLQDNLTRRLFAIHLCVHDPVRFQALCAFGVKYYGDWLRSLKSRRIEYVAVEYIYQRAQYAHYVTQQGAEALRPALLMALAEAGQILMQAWPNDVLQDLLRVLEEDWELEFMVNEYGSAPGTYQAGFYRAILAEAAQQWGVPLS